MPSDKIPLFSRQEKGKEENLIKEDKLNPICDHCGLGHKTSQHEDKPPKRFTENGQ